MKIMISVCLAMAIFYAINTNAYNTDPTPCETCKDGVDGKDGINGKNGLSGINGTNGHNGHDGRNGVTTIIHEQSCPACLEDRIDMGDAIVAAVPNSMLGDHDNYGIFLAGGFVDNQRGLGLGAAIRLQEYVQFSLGVATNLTDVCNDLREHCLTHYDKLDKWAGQAQLSIRW